MSDACGFGVRRVRVRRFGADASGASAVEFAMVAGPFLLIVIAVLELALDYLYFSQLDYAVHKASERFRTGAVTAENMSVGKFKSDVLCPQLSQFDCDKIVINLVPASAGAWWSVPNSWHPETVSPATARWCPAGAGELSLVQVAYPVPFANLIWAGQRSKVNGVRYYLSSNAFRNDVFGLKPTPRPGC